MREHLSNDYFWGLGQLVATDQSMGLLFESGVAAQKLNSARLQRLHAGVLIRRVWIIGDLRRTSLTIREIVDVTNGRLAGGWICHLEPLSYLVLCPDSVGVINHVRRSV